SLSSHLAPRALHSFPTRRSSDLIGVIPTVVVKKEPGSESRPRWPAYAQAERKIRCCSRRSVSGSVYQSQGSVVSIAPNLHSPRQDRKSTRLNSSHVAISYAVFCL